MILFIYGASAIGKTTFLKGIQHALVPPSGAKLAVVYADQGLEYHSNTIIYEKRKWRGKRAEKRHAYNLDSMVGDDSTMWVAEAMRYPNGLWPELIRAHELSNGGLRVIVPHYTGEVGQQFRQKRCDVIGKIMSEYWTIENCLSESNYRVRSCKKHLVPVGIPCEFVEINKERKEWAQVKSILVAWLREDIIGGWYK